MNTPATTYVLPLRWSDDDGLAELTRYLRWLRTRVRVVVVDGSAPHLFARHAREWAHLVEHVAPDAGSACANGKVAGVHTGVRRAATENVVIADDDVRYDGAALDSVVRRLAHADLVRPQNYFAPAPWHAVWDTARTLLNRSAGRDYPGTFGLRRSTFLAMGGYDGGVLFENLELIRTVRAHGGTEDRPLDLYVRRLPPDASRFWSQRVRQAYDDTAQPLRMLAFLAVVPAVAVAMRRRPLLTLAAATGLPMLFAEVGRRRGGGARVFPASATAAAPLWVAERAVCSWLALAAVLKGTGVAYAGGRLTTAAHSSRALASVARTRVGRAGGGEPDRLVRPVAEGLHGRSTAPA